MELGLLAAAATGVAAMWVANRLLRRRLTVPRPTDVLVGAAAVGMLIGRLAAMAGAGVNPVTHPADILIVRGGVATGWAAVGALTTLAWTFRHSLPRALDQLAPGAVAGLAGWHGGCPWRGTCSGTATDLPWAITSGASGVGRHPVELYAAVAFAFAAWVISGWMDRPWVATGSAVALAGVVRLATQPLRVSVTGGPVWWYTAAVAVGLGAAVWGQRRIFTRPPGPSSMEM